MNVLFVCTGNICRSPMAEALLRHHAGEAGMRVDVRSSGTHAFDGSLATHDARAVMSEYGVNMDKHRASELTDDLVGWADLVVCLAAEHARSMAHTHPDAGAKTVVLKPAVRALEDSPPPTREKLGLYLRHRGAEEGDTDVEDPYGDRREAYLRIRDEIDDLIQRFVKAVAAVPE